MQVIIAKYAGGVDLDIGFSKEEKAAAKAWAQRLDVRVVVSREISPIILDNLTVLGRAAHRHWLVASRTSQSGERRSKIQDHGNIPLPLFSSSWS